MALFAYRDRDPVLGILAWLFFVPYISMYSFVLHIAMLAIKLPRWTILLVLCVWFVYGQLMLRAALA
jgi:hypothetical protein